MAAVPVHEHFGPFVCLHLIVIISLGAITQKEPSTIVWSGSGPHSSFSFTVSWEAHSSAPFEVSLVHPI